MPVSEITEVSDSSQLTKPIQQQIERTLDQIQKQATKLNDEDIIILKAKQQLFTQKRQKGEKLLPFFTRKITAFFTNGIIEIATLQDNTKEEQDNIKEKGNGDAQKQTTLQVLGKVPRALFLYSKAFISATFDAVLVVDTDGRRKTSNRFPTWKDTKEADIRLANNMRKLAEDAQKLINKGNLTPCEIPKLTILAEQLEAKALKIMPPTHKKIGIVDWLTHQVTLAANKKVILGPTKQPAQTTQAITGAAPSTNESKRIDNSASLSTPFQEKLIKERSSSTNGEKRHAL